MNTDTQPSPQRLPGLAHRCISAALRFGYSRQVTSQRRGTPARLPRAKEITNKDSGARTRDIVRQYLAEVATHERLSSREEYRLAVSARDGDVEARRRLIEHQLGLVVMIARRYCGRALPLLDLIEEGNIGLMTAIEKFDPEKGWRLATYAKWWIRQSIQLALMTQANVVRIPVHVARAPKRCSRVPANGDAARSTNTTASGKPRVAPQCLLHDMRNRAHANQAAQDELQAFLDGIAAPEHEQPDRQVQLMGQRKCLESALLRIKDTERLVLRLRFGLTNDVDHTLRDIARHLDVSIERVRQIQTEALAKLRHVLQTDIGLGHDCLL